MQTLAAKITQPELRSLSEAITEILLTRFINHMLISLFVIAGLPPPLKRSELGRITFAQPRMR